MQREVTTQQELDAALADSFVTEISIKSHAERVLLTVRAFDSATVRAFDSATVHAFGSATVRASTHVAIHRHSVMADVVGGVVIDHTAVDIKDADAWTGYVGASRKAGVVTLFKAVDQELRAGHVFGRPTRYGVGDTVTADDWRDDNTCGGGLHASPSTGQAGEYRPRGEASRFLRVEVAVEDLRPISLDKAKARSLRVVAEVDENGKDLLP